MNIGIIFAGGIGSRFGLINKPKQFVEVNGKPIIAHTIVHFEKCVSIDKIVVVCVSDWIDYMNKIKIDYSFDKVEKIVPGGKTGQESIYFGLRAAKEISKNQESIVLIHDGVRPLINSQLLTDSINNVKQYGSSIACAKMTETAVEVNENEILKAYSRPQIQVAKAPQCFWLSEILEAHEDSRKKGKEYIDSCSLMMNYKKSLHFTECGSENIKITFFEDIYLLQAMLRAREDELNFANGGLK